MRIVPSRRTSAMLLAVLLLTTPGCVLDYATRITPPPLEPPRPESRRYEDAAVHVGPAYLARRGKVWVMHVEGEPKQLGYRHARLTTPLMTEGERRMLDLFGTYVPSAFVRWALTSIARVRYRNLDEGFPSNRRAEIFGLARGYTGGVMDFFPPYQRLVYLQSLYDIALAFERSPLIGCTAFAASGPATEQGTTPGHTIVGRNFDLEIDPWFDEDKVVQIVEPTGGIPFASVAWPGMTGVVTGMNAAGIWVSVNGGRAGEIHADGVPVVFTTRAVLEGARSLDDALRIIGEDRPMVSHILLLADGDTGESMVVERAPGRPLGVIRHPSTTVLANHFLTPALRDDPKNERIRHITSTIARHARMEELVTRHDGIIDPPVALAMLRDRSGIGGAPLPLGNRNALDALVTTHSVVADLTARVLWVSEGPMTLGPYRRIDLEARLERGEAAAEGEAEADFPTDTLLADEAYDRYLLASEARAEADRRAAKRQHDRAVELYRRALALRSDDHLAWQGLARVQERLGHEDAAREAWRRVLALAPEAPEARLEAERHVEAH